MNIDKNKNYTTRAGEKVEIYRTNALGWFPVIGAIKRDNNLQKGWEACEWTKDGFRSTIKDVSPTDLIEGVKYQELQDLAKGPLSSYAQVVTINNEGLSIDALHTPGCKPEVFGRDGCYFVAFRKLYETVANVSSY